MQTVVNAPEPDGQGWKHGSAVDEHCEYGQVK